MRPRLLFFLLCCLSLPTARKAMAAPIVIEASRAANPPRTDPGTGICTTTVHVTNNNALTTPEGASTFIDLSPGTSVVDDKVTFPYSAINFHNSDSAAQTDYPAPLPLPFTNLNGTPKIGNEMNFAMRVRGYVNIKRPGIFTFAVLADDGYSLAIAGVPIIKSSTTNISLRDSRQVQFAAAGLYPIEMIYFQMSGPAVLDMAISDRADAEVTMYNQKLGPTFVLADQGSLYSTLAGPTDCTECSADATCGTGKSRYCRDGLCQACVLNNHCGADCKACSSTTPLCVGGGCVQCSATSHKVCDDQGQFCVNNQCMGCTVDAQCGANKICDTTFNQCIVRPDLSYAGGCSAAPSGGTPPLDSAPARGLLLLFAAFLLGTLLRARGTFRENASPGPRRRRRPGSAGAAGMMAIVAAALSQPGTAQAQDASTGTNPVSFNAQTFRPAIGPGNVFTVEGTLLPRRLFPLGGVVFDYANQPLRLVLNSTGAAYATPVPFMLTAHVMPGFGITSWASVALDVPIVLYQGFDNRTPTGDVPNSPSAAGVGDLRLVTKIRILNNENGGIGLAAVPQFILPTGSDTAFRGDGTFGVEPRLAVDYRFKNGTFVALNLSYYLRTYNRQVDFGLVRVSDQVRYGVGTGINLVKGLGVAAEINGAVGLSKFDGGPLYAPLEGFAGVRYAHSSGIEAGIGGGTAFVSAVGTPNFRLFASIGFSRPGKKAPAKSSLEEDADDMKKPGKPTPGATDSDADGVPDSADKCPLVPGPKENHGCPELDSDGDGVVDRLDKCPRQPGVKENNGCPDVDTDADGVPDRLDKCPKESGPASNDGCPVAASVVVDGDRDKDGVPDKDDKCPDQAGPAENNGCPDQDSDGDGVVDRLDKCPQQAGPKESGGCPGVVITEDGITLAQPIRFKAGTPDLEPASIPVIVALAKAIQGDPAIKKVSIQVTASGDKKSAKKLAGKRAKVLGAALSNAGVPKKKLSVKAARAPGGDEISEIGVKKGKVKASKGKREKKPKKEKKAKGEHKHHHKKKGE